MTKKKLWIVIIIEILLIGCAGFFMLKNIPPREVVSPTLAAWESRFVSFDGGIWHADESIYPADEAGEDGIDLLYGPFFSLAQGSYSISVDYKSDDDQAFEVYSASAPDRILIHEEEILKASSQTVTSHFTLTGPVDDLEIRVHYNGTGAMEIKNISVAPSTFFLRLMMLSLCILAFILDVCLFIAGRERIEGTSAASGSRKQWIDVCRGFGILLVLLGHVDPPFKWLIFGFHIPLFFILSGYLYNDTENTKDFLLKNFKRYMIPYFGLCFVNLVITIIRTSLEDGITSEWVIRYVKGIIYCDEWLPNCLPLWFLAALFLTMAAMHFLHRTESVSVRCIMLLACCAGVIMMERFECPDLPWCMGQAVMGLVFAEAGYLLKKYDVIERLSGAKTTDKLGVLIVLAVCGYSAILINHESIEAIVSMRSMRYGHFPLWIAGAVCVSLLLMFASAIIVRPGSKRETVFSPLSALGRHTILFFAFDFCMGMLAEDILHMFLGFEPWYFVFALKLILLIVLYAIWHLIKDRRGALWE